MATVVLQAGQLEVVRQGASALNTDAPDSRCDLPFAFYAHAIKPAGSRRWVFAVVQIANIGLVRGKTAPARRGKTGPEPPLQRAGAAGAQSKRDCFAVVPGWLRLARCGCPAANPEKIRRRA